MMTAITPPRNADSAERGEAATGRIVSLRVEGSQTVLTVDLPKHDRAEVRIDATGRPELIATEVGTDVQVYSVLATVVGAETTFSALVPGPHGSKRCDLTAPAALALLERGVHGVVRY